MQKAVRAELEELVLGARGSAPASSTISGMLDEIARLRSILREQHAECCKLMRSGNVCDCGHVSDANTALLEVHMLRAELIQSRRMAACHLQEINRLDSLIRSKDVPPVTELKATEGADVLPIHGAKSGKTVNTTRGRRPSRGLSAARVSARR